MNSWLLLSLLMAHVIGDFYLQSDKYCKKKEESKLKSPFLYVHSILIGLLSWAFVSTVDFWIYALLIFVTHLLIDAMKSYMCKGLWSFLIDQIAHIIILCFIAHLYVSQCHLPIQSIDFLNHISIPAFVFAILCCLKPTNILIKLILERYKIVLIGQYEAVGFIIAAKSVLRFKDTDTAKTEYVLAGTLLSFGIATLLGLMVKQLSLVF